MCVGRKAGGKRKEGFGYQVVRRISQDDSEKLLFEFESVLRADNSLSLSRSPCGHLCRAHVQLPQQARVIIETFASFPGTCA